MEWPSVLADLSIPRELLKTPFQQVHRSGQTDPLPRRGQAANSWSSLRARWRAADPSRAQPHSHYDNANGMGDRTGSADISETISLQARLFPSRTFSHISTQARSEGHRPQDNWTEWVTATVSLLSHRPQRSPVSKTKSQTGGPGLHGTLALCTSLGRDSMGHAACSREIRNCSQGHDRQGKEGTHGTDGSSQVA